MEGAAARIRAWRDDAVRFARECCGMEPDGWQEEALRYISRPGGNRLALKASKGVGKTALLAVIQLWYLVTRPHPRIACTSITGENLRAGLWSEAALWIGRSPFLKAALTWTATTISAKGHEATWWAMARAWPKGGSTSQQADTLAGLHAEHCLFILDEAGGIPDAVMAAAEAGLTTGGDAKLVIAGNPTHLEGPLYRAATRERNLWHVIEISGDPDDPKRAKRVDVAWARAQIEKYGRDNPYVLVNVFGKFPPSSLNQLLGPDDVAASIKRNPMCTEYDWAERRIGVDVARFGDDRSILFPRQGVMAYPCVEMRNATTDQIAARIAAAQSRWNADQVMVDDTGGYGAGVVDFCHAAGIGVVPVNASSKPDDERYANRRAEMWWRMAEWVKGGGALPDDADLVRELTAPTYTFTAQGKLIIESKDDIKTRLGSSPDKADALAQTFAIAERPRGGAAFYTMAGTAARIKSDWEPGATP